LQPAPRAFERRPCIGKTPLNSTLKVALQLVDALQLLLKSGTRMEHLQMALKCCQALRQGCELTSLCTFESRPQRVQMLLDLGDIRGHQLGRRRGRCTAAIGSKIGNAEVDLMADPGHDRQLGSADRTC